MSWMQLSTIVEAKQVKQVPNFATFTINKLFRSVWTSNQLCNFVLQCYRQYEYVRVSYMYITGSFILTCQSWMYLQV